MENKNPTPSPPSQPKKLSKKTRLWMLAFFVLATVALVPVFWGENPILFKGAGLPDFGGGGGSVNCSSITIETECNNQALNVCHWRSNQCQKNVITITADNSGLDISPIQLGEKRIVGKYTIENTTPMSIKVIDILISKNPGTDIPEEEKMKNSTVLSARLYTSAKGWDANVTPANDDKIGSINKNFNDFIIPANQTKTLNLRIDMPGQLTTFEEGKKIQFSAGKITAVNYSDNQPLSIKLSSPKNPVFTAAVYPPKLDVPKNDSIKIPGGDVVQGTQNLYVSKMQFVATNKPVEVDKIKLAIDGTAFSTDFQDVTIRNILGNFLANTSGFNATTKKAEFNFEPNITINANDKMTFQVKTTISSTAAANNIFALTIASPDDITVLTPGTEKTVSGLNNLADIFTIKTVPTLGIVPASDNPPAGNIIIGTANANIAKINFAITPTTNTVPVKIKKIIFTLDTSDTANTIAKTDVTNIAFRDSLGTSLKTVAALNASNQAVFDWESIPLILDPTSPKSFFVTVDFPAEAQVNKTLKFTLAALTDIVKTPIETIVTGVPFSTNSFRIIPIPPKPDLQIESSQFTPANPKPGDHVTLTATVINKGGGTAEAGSRTKLILEAFATSAWAQKKDLLKDTQSLAQNVTQTFTWNENDLFDGPPTADASYRYKVCVDENPSIIDEGTEGETNNCSAYSEFSVLTPPPASLYISAMQPPEQLTELPAEPNTASSWAKLIQMKFHIANGDPAVNKLKKLVLNFIGDSALVSKITDFRLYDGNNAQIEVGASGKPIKKITPDNVNGTITIEFQTTGDQNVSLDSQKTLTLRAKVNPGRANTGKKFKYAVKSAEVIPPEANKTYSPALNGPEFTIASPTPLNCPNGQTETPEGVCACPANTYQYSGDEPTKYSPNVCLACRASKLKNIKGVLYCPGDEPPPPEECPAGQTGTPPNCVAPPPPPEECPAGTTGTPPNCVSPPPPGPPPTTGFIACEAVSKFTYYGPTKPGVRETGMCIDCPTETYIKLGGKCEKEKKPDKKDGTDIAGDGDKKDTQTDRGQDNTSGDDTLQTDTSRTDTDKRPSAYDGDSGDLALDDSQRIVKAPEKSETGPGIGIYIGIVAAAQALYWLRKKNRI